ncbi:gsr2070 [Gloeobacter violaceus PCC 7421]|uniref:Gsr2070 protein n=2 Tax=Gloeobacter violaceus TaxID=33072 RepID=Q7NIW2_GLOVI|nr:gsr2070 [Gloeobacter violaceus PCC 7421]
MGQTYPAMSLPNEPKVQKPEEPAPSYVKLAMRNMVRKRGTSLKHFALTLAAVLAFFVLLSVVFRG